MEQLSKVVMRNPPTLAVRISTTNINCREVRGNPADRYDNTTKELDLENDKFHFTKLSKYMYAVRVLDPIS